VLDTAGWPLAATRLTFTTAPRGGAAGGGGAGSSDPRSPNSSAPGQPAERDGDRGRGDDQDDAPGTDARSLPPLVAGAGVTAVSGRALQLDEIPPGHREMLIEPPASDG